jgi:hypothetical protein
MGGGGGAGGAGGGHSHPQNMPCRFTSSNFDVSFQPFRMLGSKPAQVSFPNASSTVVGALAGRTPPAELIVTVVAQLTPLATRDSARQNTKPCIMARRDHMLPWTNSALGNLQHATCRLVHIVNTSNALLGE